MKKLLLISSLTATSMAVNAQVNVSTTPENRTAVLEEYTGNFCTYCPQGHQIADEIYGNLDAITLKIQVGAFAGPDPLFGGSLITPTGSAIAAPFDSEGYPNGTVSRMNTYAGIGRGNWQSAVQAVNAMPAPVNLYVESSIDVATRQLTVSVEYYYTAAASTGTNYLSIGYYQDNIPAYQYDPGFNPNQFYILDAELYEFDHAFRDMINGTWGEIINNTASGSTGIITHTMTLPEDFDGFTVEPGAIKVFAYMAASQQGEILNAEKATPVYSNFPNGDEIGIVYATNGVKEGCAGSDGSASPVILVATYGEDNLTSFTSTYGVNGGTSTNDWTGTLAHNEKTAVELDPATFTYLVSNTLNIAVSSPNGETDPTLTDNGVEATFAGVSTQNSDKIRIEVKTDAYTMDESEFKVYNGAGTEIFASGPLPNSAVTSYIVTLPVGTDCYDIKLMDNYGDGWGYNVTAYMKVYDVTGGANTLLRNIPQADNFGAELDLAFSLTSAGSALGVESNTLSGLSIYPNPASSVVNIEFDAEETDYEVSLVDISGRQLTSMKLTSVSGAQLVKLPVEGVAAGNYIVKIKSNSGVTTYKVAVQ